MLKWLRILVQLVQANAELEVVYLNPATEQALKLHPDIGVDGIGVTLSEVFGQQPEDFEFMKDPASLPQAMQIPLVVKSWNSMFLQLKVVTVNF